MGRVRRVSQGLSLIELMIALALAGVLLAIGIPAFNGFVLPGVPVKIKSPGSSVTCWLRKLTVAGMS